MRHTHLHVLTRQMYAVLCLYQNLSLVSPGAIISHCHIIKKKNHVIVLARVSSGSLTDPSTVIFYHLVLLFGLAWLNLKYLSLYYC